MWVLFLVFVLPTGGETGYAIETYDTYDKCHTDEVRIDAEMRQSYWKDKTQQFYFTCLTKAKGVA